MYLAAVLQKLRCGDAAALPADDVLHMATVGGAQAMGLTDCDVLAPGKQADLIVIDLQRPNMRRCTTLRATWSTAARRRTCA